MIQLLSEPIPGPIAFKTVAVKENPFRLVSPTYPMDWLPHQLGGPATCARKGHYGGGLQALYHSPDQAVVKGCTCGIYGARDYHLSDNYVGIHPDNVIILFEGQGDVMMHRRGFRSQWARVIAVVRRLPGQDLPNDKLDIYQMWMVLAAQHFDVPLIEHQLAMQMATIQWARYDAKLNTPA